MRGGEPKSSQYIRPELQIGQKNLMRLSAFARDTHARTERRRPPASADVTDTDRAGQRHYYTSRSMPPEEVNALGGPPSCPALPVEASSDGDRPCLSYHHAADATVLRAFRRSE